MRVSIMQAQGVQCTNASGTSAPSKVGHHATAQQDERLGARKVREKGATLRPARDVSNVGLPFAYQGNRIR